MKKQSIFRSCKLILNSNTFFDQHSIYFTFIFVFLFPWIARFLFLIFSTSNQTSDQPQTFLTGLSTTTSSWLSNIPTLHFNYLLELGFSIYSWPEISYRSHQHELSSTCYYLDNFFIDFTSNPKWFFYRNYCWGWNCLNLDFSYDLPSDSSLLTCRPCYEPTIYL